MIDIRIRRLDIVGSGGQRTVDFSTGLNVVAGPYGSGKTSLLELLKYALGGSARLSEAVKNGVTSVILEVSLAGTPYTFERDIGQPRIRVTQAGEMVATLHSTSGNAKGTQLASSFLLEQLGLPAMRVQRAKSTASTKKESISFWDVFRYAYVSQNEMGQSIAGHADSNLNRKRRRAFELMFGLIDEELADLETSEAETTALISAEVKRLGDVTTFLEDAGLPSRGQALELQRSARALAEDANESLQGLRTSSRAQTPDLDPERDEVGSLVALVADLDRSAQTVRSEIAERRHLSAQLTVDLERLQRTHSTSSLLGPIDFAQCPRCLQQVSSDRVEHPACYLCTQAVPPSPDDEASADDELLRLSDVRSEVETLLAEDEATLEVIERRLSQKTGELALAQTRLRQRADSYVAPMFEDIAALSREVASAESEDRRLQLVLDQWDERDEISNTVRSLRLAAEQQRRRVEEKKAQIERRRELVQEFSETFDEIVSELELAWYETAAVDLTTFMPLIGDSDFESLSGGQRTVVSVAYHLALLTVGLVHPGDVRIPSLLILDTPSKYLGAKDSEQVARDYRRIASIVDAYQLPLQIVVADNDPPPKGVSPSNLIELSYESPLVPGLDHPGGDAVVPIHDEYEAE